LKSLAFLPFCFLRLKTIERYNNRLRSINKIKARYGT